MMPCQGMDEQWAASAVLEEYGAVRWPGGHLEDCLDESLSYLPSIPLFLLRWWAPARQGLVRSFSWFPTGQHVINSVPSE